MDFGYDWTAPLCEDLIENSVNDEYYEDYEVDQRAYLNVENCSNEYGDIEKYTSSESERIADYLDELEIRNHIDDMLTNEFWHEYDEDYCQPQMDAHYHPADQLVYNGGRNKTKIEDRVNRLHKHVHPRKTTRRQTNKSQCEHRRHKMPHNRLVLAPPHCYGYKTRTFISEYDISNYLRAKNPFMSTWTGKLLITDQVSHHMRSKYRRQEQQFKHRNVKTPMDINWQEPDYSYFFMSSREENAFYGYEDYRADLNRSGSYDPSDWFEDYDGDFQGWDYWFYLDEADWTDHLTCNDDPEYRDRLNQEYANDLEDDFELVIEEF